MNAPDSASSHPDDRPATFAQCVGMTLILVSLFLGVLVVS